jgi:hypothetical protein
MEKSPNVISGFQLTESRPKGLIEEKMIFFKKKKKKKNTNKNMTKKCGSCFLQKTNKNKYVTQRKIFRL